LDAIHGTKAAFAPRVLLRASLDEGTNISRAITHQLRNALGVMLGHLDVLACDDEMRELHSRRLGNMRDRAAEMTTLVAQLEEWLEEGAAARALDATLRVDGASLARPLREHTTARPPDSAEVDELVGDCYRVTGLLGRGGMGTALMARDERLDRDVAIKFLDNESWDSEDARAIFLREARAMAQVRHPHVVSIFSFGEHRGWPYFVMEYVPGTNLERLLSTRGAQLELDEALAILDQICCGVIAIHKAGAIHRDLKPSNILIGPASHVAVADLGLVHRAGDPMTAKLRGGTPGYIAPELIVLDTPPDERVDVYALGVIAYELLTGARAFSGERYEAIVGQQLHGDIPPVSIRRATLPPHFDEVVRRAMAVDPCVRTPTAEAFRKALLEAREQLDKSYGDVTVFVVDDDPDMRSYIAGVVGRALPLASVRAFADASEALAAASIAPPCLAVVDLDLPRINGVELTAMLRGSHAGRNCEVLVVTGVGGARDWKALQQIGASGFMVKPVEPVALTAMVRKLVAGARTLRLQRAPIELASSA
jgi:eukaryotic-like serine/threonine-protein kinase